MRLSLYLQLLLQEESIIFQEAWCAESAWVGTSVKARPANTNRTQAVIADSSIVEDDLNTATTVNRNEAETVVGTIISPRSLDSALLATASSGFVQRLTTFLEKPVILRQGSWSGASPTQMHAIALPEELLSQDVYKDKVDGFLAFRATLVIRLQLNANPFQQGILMMYYIPQAQVDGMFPYLRSYSLRTKTQLPHIKIDAACDSEGVLKVPYTSPTSHYNLLDGTGPTGAVYLDQYASFGYGNGASSADYIIWGSFEDIELITPTLSNVFVSQSGRNRRRITGNARKRDITDEEIASSDIGPLQQAFRGVSMIASSAGKVPMLSSFAGTAKWASDALANAAKYFGLSNPAYNGVRAKLSIFPNITNADTIDMSYPISLTSENKTQVLPGFAGTDIDEMNINYVCSIPSFHNYFNWTSSQPVGTLLHTQPLYPQAFCTGTVIPSGGYNWTVYDYSPMAFVSSLFEFYRGSVRYTLRFAKTQFHSGRLMVTYAPGYTGSVVPNFDQTPYLHREIIDVREGNVFTFACPFASTKTWLRNNEPYGRLWIYVLNPLKAPDTVKQNIDVMMEVSMDEDAEFAVPRPAPHRVWGSEDTVAPFVSQGAAGMTQERNDCGMNPPGSTIGGSKEVGTGLDASIYCIGEKVVSFASLLKRSATLDWPVGSVDDVNFAMDFRPYTIGGSGNPEGAPDDDQVSRFCGDWISILAPLYAYNRGGVRLHYVAGTVETRQDVFLYTSGISDPITVDPAAAISNDATLVGNAGYLAFNTVKDGGASIQVPHYNQLHSRLNRITYANTAGGGSGFYVEPNDVYASRLRITINNSAAVTRPRLMRQASDDYALGFFLGVPPMVVSRVAI